MPDDLLERLREVHEELRHLPLGGRGHITDTVLEACQALASDEQPTLFVVFSAASGRGGIGRLAGVYSSRERAIEVRDAVRAKGRPAGWSEFRLDDPAREGVA